MLKKKEPNMCGLSKSAFSAMSIADFIADFSRSQTLYKKTAMPIADFIAEN